MDVDGYLETDEVKMISHVPSLTLLRHGYFLSPVDRSRRPPPSPYVVRASTIPVKPSDLKTRYPGWKPPPKNWHAWTDRMHSLHHSVWKQAGIRKPILNSCSMIVKHENLIRGFAEKWSPSTNTFVFQWGEATVTLEDMLVIGSYSVLGEPVFSTIQGPELIQVQKELELERKKLNERTHKVLQTQWMERFMNSGSPIEHEAYLAMWLSRFVFPTKSQSDTIGSHVLALAVLLARGVRIALAPAVLASIYASLSEMKEAMVSDGALVVSVSAPLQILQIWIWERFPVFRPNPVVLEVHPEAPWFVRWDGLKRKCTGDVGAVIEDSGGIFVWRPYYNILTRGGYTVMAEMVFISSNLDVGVEILIRCLRHSELVGMDEGCIKQYLPHRVAMQFGYDQDVPAHVARCDSTLVVAWGSYCRGVEDSRLYIPPGIYRAGITTRYQRWLNGYVPSRAVDPCPKVIQDLHVYPPPPGFPLKRKCDPPCHL